MNNLLNGIQWRKITILLIVFILAFVSLVVSTIFYFFASENLSSTNIKLAAIENRTYTAVENSVVLSDSMQSLHALYEKGVLGEPLRLDWVNTLQDIITKYEIPSIGFTVNPTLSKSIDEYGAEQEAHIFKTPMVLEMKLMHEGDFYQFLTAFKKQSKGFFQVDFCEIKRLGKDLRNLSNIAQLNADCELTWFNYKDLRQEWFANDI